ncbi:MAG: hypothetical protein HN931_03075 [Desulfobacterales bacterium]|jgi:hypothetical protein|nr:hypothetical protein [Desulfobacteraceae bacterium]MBT4365628.1 hypothetical protein [Desulfobacteraceae bacterium]MBT7085138.1 hypothetical protein [Desulfobacterales bacterium]
MKEDNIIYFKQYPFETGQKINIVDGPRKGDWEVLEVSDYKVRLRCPVSLKEFNWDRFCYSTTEN